MAYRWQASLSPDAPATPDDLASAGIGTEFDDQAAAEDWLGAFFADLQDLGVTEVSLFEEDRLVYGPMPLDE